MIVQNPDDFDYLTHDTIQKQVTRLPHLPQSIRNPRTAVADMVGEQAVTNFWMLPRTNPCRVLSNIFDRLPNQSAISRPASTAVLPVTLVKYRADIRSGSRGKAGLGHSGGVFVQSQPVGDFPINSVKPSIKLLIIGDFHEAAMLQIFEADPRCLS